MANNNNEFRDIISALEQIMNFQDTYPLSVPSRLKHELYTTFSRHNAALLNDIINRNDSQDIYKKLEEFLESFANKELDYAFDYFSRLSSPLTRVLLKIAAHLHENFNSNKTVYQTIFPSLHQDNLKNKDRSKNNYPENIDEIPLEQLILSEDKQSLIPMALVQTLSARTDNEEPISNPYTDKPLTEKERHDLLSHPLTGRKYRPISQGTLNNDGINFTKVLIDFQTNMENRDSSIDYVQYYYQNPSQYNQGGAGSVHLASNNILIKKSKQNIATEQSNEELLEERNQEKIRIAKKLIQHWENADDDFKKYIGNHVIRYRDSRLSSCRKTERLQDIFDTLENALKTKGYHDPELLIMVTQAALKLSPLVGMLAGNHSYEIIVGNDSLDSLELENELKKRLATTYVSLAAPMDKMDNKKNPLHPDHLSHCKSLKEAAATSPIIDIVFKRWFIDIYQLAALPAEHELSAYQNSFILLEDAFYYVDEGSQPKEIGLNDLEEFTRKITKKLTAAKSSHIVLSQKEIERFIASFGGKAPLMGTETNPEEIAEVLCDLCTMETSQNLIINGQKGITLLEWAIKGDHIALVNKILMKASELEISLDTIVNTKNNYKVMQDSQVVQKESIQYPLHDAITAGRFEIMKSLLHFIINNEPEALLICDGDNNNILHTAILSNNELALDYLLSEIPYIKKHILSFIKENAQKHTPLSLALNHNFIKKLLPFIVQHGSIALVLSDKYGNNIFHRLIAFKNYSLWDFFLTQIPLTIAQDLLVLPNSQKCSVLSYAFEQKEYNFIIRLLEKGYIHQRFINTTQDRKNNTLLHLAIQHGQFSPNNTHLDLIKISEMLLTLEPDFSVKNSDGFSPLHCAAAEHNKEIVKAILIKAKTSGDRETLLLQTNPNANMAIHLALANIKTYSVNNKATERMNQDKNEVLDLLLNEIIELNLLNEVSLHQTARKNTILHLAAEKQEINFITKVINAINDVHTLDVLLTLKSDFRAYFTELLSNNNKHTINLLITKRRNEIIELQNTDSVCTNNVPTVPAVHSIVPECSLATLNNNNNLQTPKSAETTMEPANIKSEFTDLSDNSESSINIPTVSISNPNISVFPYASASLNNNNIQITESMVSSTINNETADRSDTAESFMPSFVFSNNNNNKSEKKQALDIQSTSIPKSQGSFFELPSNLKDLNNLTNPPLTRAEDTNKQGVTSKSLDNKQGNPEERIHKKVVSIEYLNNKLSDLEGIIQNKQKQKDVPNKKGMFKKDTAELDNEINAARFLYNQLRALATDGFVCIQSIESIINTTKTEHSKGFIKSGGNAFLNRMRPAPLLVQFCEELVRGPGNNNRKNPS